MEVVHMAKALVENDVAREIFLDDSIDHATAGDVATKPPAVRIHPGLVVIVEPPLARCGTDHPVWEE